MKLSFHFILNWWKTNSTEILYKNPLPSSSSFLSRRKYCILPKNSTKSRQLGDLQNGDVAEQSTMGRIRGLKVIQRRFSLITSRCSVAVKITLTGKWERISQFKIYILYLFLSYDPVDTYVTFFNSRRIE